MSNRKPTFFTADWHCFHANSIKFDNRPFRDVEHMHKVLVNNYNAIVPPSGVCYFLGDMGMGPSGEMKSFLAQLNGTKILVLGNHDKGTNSMYNIGFDVVLHGAMTYIAGERVTMSHCPLLGVYREDTTGMKRTDGTENWHGESRETHQKLSFTDEGQFHLSGHIHSPNSGKSQRTLGRQMDVGVVANDYRPVSISKIESWIAQVKKEETNDTTIGN